MLIPQNISNYGSSRVQILIIPIVFHTLAFTQTPVWATSGPWLSAPIGRFPRKTGDVLVPSAGGGVGNQHDTTQLARELHKGIKIWKRRWCNGISEQVDRTGKSIRPWDNWQLETPLAPIKSWLWATIQAPARNSNTFGSQQPLERFRKETSY